MGQLGRRSGSSAPRGGAAIASQAMSDPTKYLELRCGECSWAEVCGPGAIVAWLRKAGKLRAGGEPELPIMHELFRVTAPRLSCPECGKVGLVAATAMDDRSDWPAERVCELCSRPISRQRSEAVPGATLCVACQRDDELGLTKTQTDYCPRCGAPMELRLAKSSVPARYVLACTANPPCRL